MTSKPFSPKLYANDDSAKDLVIEWLKSQDYKAWVNPDQYGIDVLAVDPYGDEFQIEVEVKHNWKGKYFGFDGVHFSGRKRKFAKPDYFTKFIMLNHERTHALIVNGADFCESPIITKSTIYTENEQFVEVPVSKCTFVDLRGNTNGKNSGMVSTPL
jgi:hypothetical protein